VPMDVLWFRLSRRAADPQQTMGLFGAGRILILLNRGDYWQCGYVIAKGANEEVRQRGLPWFRASILKLLPWLADRVTELTDWEQIKLLTVRVDRLRQWYRPSALCAHLPHVRSAGYVCGEHNLFAIGRPGRAGNGTREKQIIDRNGTRTWIGGRHDCFGIGEWPRIWPQRLSL